MKREWISLIVAGVMTAFVAATAMAVDWSEYEYESDEGLHEEEWYDPSDWFDVDPGVSYEDDDWWDYDYYDYDLYDEDVYDGWEYEYEPYEGEYELEYEPYDAYDEEWEYDYDLYDQDEWWQGDDYEDWDYEYEPLEDEYEWEYAPYEVYDEELYETDYDRDYDYYEDYDYGWEYEYEPYEDQWQWEYEPFDRQWYDQEPRQQQWFGTGERGRRPAARQRLRVTGTVRQMRRFRLRGQQQPHTFAKVQTQEGRRLVVDLGPAREADQLNLSPGDQVQARGEIALINTRPVLMASRVQANEQSIRVERLQGPRTGQQQQRHGGR